MSESCNELIIDTELLANIGRQCRQRAAELEATQKVPPTVSVSEAERFAAAIKQMPDNIRRFFEHEDPARERISRGSAEERAERDQRTDLGCWCG